MAASPVRRGLESTADPARADRDRAPDPFLAACRGEPVAAHAGVVHAPGRPVAARVPGPSGRRQHPRVDPPAPTLAAEITLQPVRRYGVDAAILFSDIMVPVAAIGFGVEIRAGVGPVAERPSRSTADLDRLRPLEPAEDTPWVAETVRILVKELTRAAHRLRRRALHPGQLPGRGPPVPGPRHDQGAHVRRPGPLARAPRSPGRPVAWHSLAGPDRRGARPSRSSTAGPGRSSPGDYRQFVLPADDADLRGHRRPRTCPGSISASAPGSCSASWPGPAPTSSGSTGGCRSARRRERAPTATGRPGQPRPGASAWPPWERSRTAGPDDPAGAAQDRATSSTSATACCPRPTPDVLAGLVDLVHEETAGRLRVGRGRRRGIAGLAAAWELRDQAEVTVFEPDRLGGKILTRAFEGRDVECGPGRLHHPVSRRGPAVRRARGRTSWSPPRPGGPCCGGGGRLRPLPEGLVLGVPRRSAPCRLRALVSAGPGPGRADLVLPRRPLGSRHQRVRDLVVGPVRQPRSPTVWSTRWSGASTPGAPMS